MASSTLATIQTKVRRIVRAPSAALLSDADLNQYINTFIENNFPTSLKLFALRTVFTFYTNPGQDVYETTLVDPADPFYNFRNKYTAIHAPVYIGGVQAFFTQYRDIFYANWPQTNTIKQTGFFGNGTPGPFTGNVGGGFAPVPLANNYFILKNSVLFTALDTNGNAMKLVDYPISTTTGALGLPGVPTTSVVPYGQINYQTGDYTLTFANNTLLTTQAVPNPLWVEYIAYGAGIPTTVLFYDQKFVLRPVPDKSYIVQVEANIRPTELLQQTDNPYITQWWQYIALGAAKLIFEDRMDYESVNQIMPTYKEQEAQVLSTSMEQWTESRSQTIYSNNGYARSWNNNAWGQWPY